MAPSRQSEGRGFAVSALAKPTKQKPRPQVPCRPETEGKRRQKPLLSGFGAVFKFLGGQDVLITQFACCSCFREHSLAAKTGIAHQRALDCHRKLQGKIAPF